MSRDEIADRHIKATTKIYYNDPTVRYDYGDNIHDDTIYVAMRQYDEQLQHDQKSGSTIYSDATGRYPHRSFAGSLYIIYDIGL